MLALHLVDPTGNIIKIISKVSKMKARIDKRTSVNSSNFCVRILLLSSDMLLENPSHKVLQRRDCRLSLQ